MHYDFDEVHNRLGTYCTQWDYIEDRFNKKDLIPFSISDTDFIIPKPITKKIHEVADHQIYGYTRWNHHDFKSSITTYFKRRFDTDMEEDWILYSPSVMYSVSLLIRLLSQPHDKVLTMNPMYDAFINVIKENDRELLSHHLIKEEVHSRLILMYLKSRLRKVLYYFFVHLIIQQVEYGVMRKCIV